LAGWLETPADADDFHYMQSHYEQLQHLNDRLPADHQSLIPSVVSPLLATHLLNHLSNHPPSNQPFIHPLQLLAMHFSWLHFNPHSITEPKTGMKLRI